MNLTIEIRFVPGNGRRGSRLRATDGQHSATIDYPDAAPGGNEGAHLEALKAFCKRFKLAGQFSAGFLRGRSYWVMEAAGGGNLYLIGPGGAQLHQLS